MAECTHPDFEASCGVNRIAAITPQMTANDIDDATTHGAPVDGFLMEVRVWCSVCQMPFCFRGVHLGMSFMEPRMSLDSKTITLPIHPEDDPTAGIGMPGYNVNVRTDG